MLGDGSVRRLSLSVGDVTDAFQRAGNKDAADQPGRRIQPRHFIDLYAALVSVPAIGKRLLGEDGFAACSRASSPASRRSWSPATALYSFKGSGYVRGGIFDRFEVIQGDTQYPLPRSHAYAVWGHSRRGRARVSGGGSVPRPRGQPRWTRRNRGGCNCWRNAASGARDKAFLTFDLGYELPQAYLKPASAACRANRAPHRRGPASELNEPPLWQAMWREKLDQIGILLVALTVLLPAIFFFQDWFVRRPRPL